MKENKFRAWDSIEECMIPWEYFRDEHNMEDLFSKELCLMQYIGIHDINDKEIWEGDILKHDDTNWGYGGKYDEENDGYLYTIVPNIHKVLLGNFDYDTEYFCYWEIVGNIYENPKMING